MLSSILAGVILVSLYLWAVFESKDKSVWLSKIVIPIAGILLFIYIANMMIDSL